MTLFWRIIGTYPRLRGFGFSRRRAAYFAASHMWSPLVD